MNSLRQRLAKRLEGAERVTFLAVGSRLRGDDGAGLLVAALLRRHLRGHRVKPVVTIIMGDTAPENFTGQIKRFSPTHLVILDAADAARPVGSIDLVDPTSPSANLSASTHSLPMKMLVDYILHYTPCDVTIIGIQPVSAKFGLRISPPVRQAARNLARLIAEIIVA